MDTRTLFSVISLVALLGFSSAVRAQPAGTPALDEILDRLEANLKHYDARVPSLYCDEHVVSTQVEPGERDQDISTDSIFRLKRVTSQDHSASLQESREIQTVDGKPATSQDVYPPTMLSGAFEGGLAIVSRNQTTCMNYRLGRNKGPVKAYIVRFATGLTHQNSAGCLLQEDSKGRVFIDPATMQITHLELTTPRHVIIPGSSFLSPVIGRRDLRIDYAPVALGGETFWMPASINMHNVSGSGTFHMRDWSYEATYRDYHLLEVTSHILAGNETPAP